jgi:superoxide dismutase, Cu-Zn family
VKTILLAGAMALLVTPALAATKTAKVSLIDDTGVKAEIGTVTFTDTKTGLKIETKLAGLPPGRHGMHIHEKGDCGPAMKDGKQTAGEKAGGHYDPKKTGKHMGPESSAGHTGDLPVLVVDDQGKAEQTLAAPRLKTADLANRSIMIHESGDNYADEPEPMGGSKGRIACGVIK